MSQDVWKDKDFEHIASVVELTVTGSSLHFSSITNAAFAPLRALHTLNISSMQQLTDAVFVHLTSLRHLDISCCRSITDAAFAHLTHLETLVMRECKQNTLTRVAWGHLPRLRALDLSGAYPVAWAARYAVADLLQLTSLEVLNVQGHPICRQLADGSQWRMLAPLRQVYVLRYGGLQRCGWDSPDRPPNFIITDNQRIDVKRIISNSS